MQSLFSGIYKDKTVLVTGHTGFKGSWLCFWLKQMGAKVVGYSLEAPTNPNHFELLNLDIVSIIGDIRDLDKLNQVFSEYKPDIVFHKFLLDFHKIVSQVVGLLNEKLFLVYKFQKFD